MRNVCLLLLAFAICTTANAQNFLGMKVKKFGVSTTIDQDRLNGLGASYFDGVSKTGISSEIMENDFDTGDITSMICENSTVRAEITVLPFKKMQHVQLNMGTSLIYDRYESTSYGVHCSYDEPTEFYSFTSRSNEAALDASIVYNLKLWAFNLYGGVGTNLGYTFGGDLDVQGRYLSGEEVSYPGEDGGQISALEVIGIAEQHELKNILHHRAFLHGGASVIFFKRLEVGLEGRRGVGYRFNKGNSINFSDLISLGLNAKWNLR